MGSRIAAHFANARIPSLLLDIVIPGAKVRDQAARNGVEAALKGKPGAFFTADVARFITTGNFDDDLSRIRDCDWILEAVTEDLVIKRALYDRIVQQRTPGTIVSTNTSGIPLQQIAEGYPEEFREHFLGIHFFNPPRYLHLVEMIPGPATRPEITASLSEFCDLHLGKGVVPCKDTPNFIANRIGAFFGATIQRLTVEHDLTIEEVDLLTGPLIGLPKSASFRLLDIVGLDVWAHVTKNLYEGVPHDPFRDRFTMPPFLTEMVKRGWIGDKRGQGCYQRVGKDRAIHAIDWKTLEYHLAEKPRFASLENLRKLEPLSERLKALVALENKDDKVGRFLWQVLSDHILYAAYMTPEISDRIVEIDRAMAWGYGHALGPFELWDALGFEQTARRIESEGRALPENIHRMLWAQAKSFYRAADQAGQPRTEYFDLGASKYAEIELRPGITVLSELKRARGVVASNAGASLIDLGDGVVCCEFHSKMNSVGGDVSKMLRAGLAQLETNFEAMVIANQGPTFSAGADLMLILLTAQDEEWDELTVFVKDFQQLNMSLKYAAKPVVAAPFGMALGGGCEIPLHCARLQASAELYMGLVEVGVGVIPAGGGCKEMVLRSRDPKDPKKIFEQIGFAKVSGSAVEARDFGFLRDGDRISMNPERLVDDAKQLALSLVPGYAPGAPRTDITVSGDAGYALMQMGIYMAREGGYISEYDAVIGEKLAYILSGGRLSGTPQVSEQYLLDLEREMFLSLCGRKETQQRIQHMLKTGKPLRN